MPRGRERVRNTYIKIMYITPNLYPGTLIGTVRLFPAWFSYKYATCLRPPPLRHILYRRYVAITTCKARARVLPLYTTATAVIRAGTNAAVSPLVLCTHNTAVYIHVCGLVPRYRHYVTRALDANNFESDRPTKPYFLSSLFPLPTIRSNRKLSTLPARRLPGRFFFHLLAAVNLARPARGPTGVSGRMVG